MDAIGALQRISVHDALAVALRDGAMLLDESDDIPASLGDAGDEHHVVFVVGNDEVRFAVKHSDDIGEGEVHGALSEVKSLRAVEPMLAGHFAKAPREHSSPGTHPRAGRERAPTLWAVAGCSGSEASCYCWWKGF